MDEREQERYHITPRSDGGPPQRGQEEKERAGEPADAECESKAPRHMKGLATERRGVATFPLRDWSRVRADMR